MTHRGTDNRTAVEPAARGGGGGPARAAATTRPTIRPTTAREAMIAAMSEDDRWNYRARGETPSQRLDRNLLELLQEVRVAQVGVQVLLAFLLALAFTPRFTQFTDPQRYAYVVSLVLGAAATALLIAPAPFHRVVFRRRLKRELVRASSVLTLIGLVLLMLSLATVLLLILDVVLNASIAVWITLGVLCWFSMWWYVLPLCYRLGGRAKRP
jgi:hypothetical protein